MGRGGGFVNQDLESCGETLVDDEKKQQIGKVEDISPSRARKAQTLKP